MTTEDAIWLARDGQKFGPYAETDVRQWLRQGQVLPDTLGWRDGMAEWLPLSYWLIEPVATAASSPPPFAAAPPPFHAVAAPLSAVEDPRDSLPMPPSLHWFLVFLLMAVTLGLFAWIWFFVQSTWVKKIDRSSSATTLLIVALLVAFGGGFVGGAVQGTTGDAVQSVTTLLSTVIVVAAFFSMKASMQADAARRGIPMAIGGVTLFFFQAIYLQGHMTWLARWKKTGQTTPEPPKAVMWLLLLVPIVLLIALVMNYPT